MTMWRPWLRLAHSSQRKCAGVPREQWRRVQLARYLIDYAGGRFEDMVFDDDGRVTNFGVSQEKLEALIRSGTPFRTSGCPGKADDVSACNRPYGDSSPTDILSFPFAPVKRDITRILRQLGGANIKVGR